MTSQPHTFRVSLQQAKVILCTSAGLNIFFLFTTWILTQYDRYYPDGYLTESTALPSKITYLLLLQCSLSFENNIATWYSSMLLLVVAFVAIICFAVDYNHLDDWWGKILSYGWIGIGLIFTLLSFDEIGSFHETIGNSIDFAGNNNGWLFFYIIVASVGTYIILFGIIKLKNNLPSLICIILGTLLFLSNPIQEAFEINTFKSSANPAHWKRNPLLLLLEEGSELFATWFFLLAVLLYLLKIPINKAINNRLKTTKLSIAYENFYQTLLYIILPLIILLFVIVESAVKNTAEGSGNPKNWLPSMIFFTTFCISTYGYFRDKVSINHYALFSIISIFLSALYGSNSYSLSFLWKNNELCYITKFFLILLLSTATIYISPGRHRTINKLFSLFWLLFIASSFLINRSMSPGFALLAALFLFASLVFLKPAQHLTSVGTISKMP
ncbi:hypothetical protein [Hymenobacter norwichensis]|uniref:hypothetical protein n=1 Tax=Hymenobacter norwichensis TaxID=223903 RepID=UPI0012F718FD|nr:hypothetical protein [Hymenobacter norwichensis]